MQNGRTFMLLKKKRRLVVKNHLYQVKIALARRVTKLGKLGSYHRAIPAE